ncbi:MAG TPA: protein phosphatase 2C domain-containing protein [Chryseosolibacter sp.]|nr:protein phosphatase 2C domain-containing protein [Chryseosolibacter sp.]
MVGDSAIDFECISDSIKGTKSAENQDGVAIVKTSDYGLFFIFDGVGSARNSKFAVDASINFVNQNHQKFAEADTYLVEDLLLELNDHILSFEELESLTTFCLVYLDYKLNRCKVCSLGDSRIYAFSNQYISQITKDDNLPGSHMITKCLGMKSIKASDFKLQQLDIIGSFLLCTDGFYRLMEANKMRFFRILNYKNLGRTVNQLRKEVANNNSDDCTYIIIK